MAVKYSMKFTIKTLIDITETASTKINNSLEYKQQQNWMSVIQTASLRANIEILSTPTLETVELTTHTGFGTQYSGKHSVWTVEFNVEHEGFITTDALKQDFELVPFIPKLTETITVDNSVFITNNSKENNIIFG